MVKSFLIYLLIIGTIISCSTVQSETVNLQLDNAFDQFDYIIKTNENNRILIKETNSKILSLFLNDYGSLLVSSKYSEEIDEMIFLSGSSGNIISFLDSTSIKFLVKDSTYLENKELINKLSLTKERWKDGVDDEKIIQRIHSLKLYDKTSLTLKQHLVAYDELKLNILLTEQLIVLYKIEKFKQNHPNALDEARLIANGT